MGYLGYTAILQRDYPGGARHPRHRQPADAASATSCPTSSTRSSIRGSGSNDGPDRRPIGLRRSARQRFSRRVERASRTAALHARSESILRRRLRKFRRLKRGYYSFLLITARTSSRSSCRSSMNNTRAGRASTKGQYYFPMLRFHAASEFGLNAFGEPDYRELKSAVRRSADEGNWVLMPPYPYGPNESLLDLPGSPPHPPSRQHPFGTDDRGRDVLVRLAYGFNISLTFAILVMLVGDVVGIASARRSATSAAGSTSSASASSRSGRRCRSSTRSSSSARSSFRSTCRDESAACSRRSGCWS